MSEYLPETAKPRDMQRSSRRLSWPLVAVVVLLGALSGYDADAKTVRVEHSGAPGASVKASLPLSFIRNEGQVDARVSYYEQRPGQASYFTADGVYFALTNSAARLRFVGGNKMPDISGENEQAAKYNYFTGSDPDRWRRGVSAYEAVRYQDVYPGIDIRFYGNGPALEYDVIVAPGADPARIAFAYDGIKQLDFTPAGGLVVTMNDGQLLQETPDVYQIIDGRRIAIASRFRRLPTAGQANGYGFDIGDYNPDYPLVIDPVLGYSTYIGGNNHDHSHGIAADDLGYVYVAGESRSVDFPIVSAYQGLNQGDEDIVISKLDPTGSTLIYSTYIGGENDDDAKAIALDASGNVYLAGESHSQSFPVTASAYQTSRGGNEDVFIAKLDAAGANLLYSSYLGGSHEDEAFALAIDANGNAYITGQAKSNDFPIVSAYQSARAGDADAFVSKINTLASGAASLVYSTFLGGGRDDEGLGIAVDGSGRAYVTGMTESRGATAFPVTATAYQPSWAGNEEAFVSRLSPAGNVLEYSTYLGGKKLDIGHAIAVDANNIVYVTGETRSASNFPFPTTPTAIQTLNAGNLDVFVSKLDTNASGAASLLYSTYLGGNNKDIGYGIVIDAAGNAYVTGSSKSSNPEFPTTATAYQMTNAGDEDVFLAQVNPAGDTLLYSTYIGGKKEDIARGIAIDSSNNIYIAGYTYSHGTQPYPTTAGAYQGVNAGDDDGFVTKFSAPPPLMVATTTLSDGTVTAPYSQTLSAAGGTAPYSWTIVSGALPAGLTLNSTTGEISGTPTGSGTANFTVQVDDANLDSATQALTMTINAAPTIDPQTLSDATQGISYSQTLTVTGGSGPYTWSIVSGSLPAGLTLNSTTGEISGTPTGSGTANFTIQVSDANLVTATQSQSITVIAAPTIAPTTLADATQGVSYSQTLTVTGGTGPYTWSVTSGSLPAGLTLNSTTGEISGTPTGSGTANFTIQVSDANLVTDTQAQSITVNAAPTIDPVTLADAMQGVSYSQTLSVTGGTGPYTWSIVSGSLPAGLTLNPSTGEISGTPTGTGTANFTIQVADANMATTTQALSLTVSSTVGCTPTPVGSNVTIYPQADVTMTYTSVTSAGDTCVTRDRPKRALIDGYVYRGGQLPVYDITTLSAFAGTVQVCIGFNRSNFTKLNTMRLFHDNGTNWDDITTSIDLVNDVICGVTTSFSPFAIGEEAPTAITLSDFQAQKIDGQVVINWVTRSEVDNWGFRLLRSDSADGPFIALTPNLIPARGGVGLTMTYSYMDDSADSDRTYYYRLQDVNTRGLVTLHDAVALQDLSQPVRSVASATERATGDTPISKTEATTESTAATGPVPAVIAVATIVPAPVATPAPASETIDGASTDSVQPPVAVTSSTHAAPPMTAAATNDEAQSSTSGQDVPGTSNADAPPTAFSVSIEDARGHIINVSRSAVSMARADIRATDIAVVNINGSTEVSWRVANLHARGFVLQRRSPGDTAYESVVNYIPNYGEDDAAIYNYKFIDNDNNAGRGYQYRLKVLNWGIQTARRQ